MTTKAVHVALRSVGQAPEMRVARNLSRQAQGLPPPSGPRVLFLTPRDWAAHVQWEAVLGQALRLRGADVRFATCGGGLEVCDRANTWEAPPMPCRSCSAYVRRALGSHGFDPVRLSDHWSEDDDWPELDNVPFNELQSVERDGLPLGALADIPTKWFLMAAGIGDDPLGPQMMRKFLRSASRIAEATRAMLDDVQPDTVVLLNGLFIFEAVCWAVCRERGIDVVTYERGLIKETLLFRRGVAACLLDLGSIWDHWRDVPLTTAEDSELDRYLQERSVGGRTIDRFWTAPVFEAPPRVTTGRRAVLFSNLTWDSAVIGQELAFPSIQAWVEASIRWFAQHPEHELLVRVHPAETKLPGKQTREPLGPHLAATFPELPENVRVIGSEDQMSSYALMDECDVGLVFTSTTGVELALRGKPVVVAGRSHYRGRGFTIDVSTSEEFEDALDRALGDPVGAAPASDLARRYAYLFFFRAPVQSPAVEEHVLGLARITVDDLEELAPGRIADLDRVCEGILGVTDFEPGRAP
ncbi:MAG: capsular polysaccharide export protein, LipB/KpsS family [Microthrixaceae bacterium]